MDEYSALRKYMLGNGFFLFNSIPLILSLILAVSSWAYMAVGNSEYKILASICSVLFTAIAIFFVYKGMKVGDSWENYKVADITCTYAYLLGDIE